MDSLALLQTKARCAACQGRVGRRVNLVTLHRRATWDYPTAGNVLTGESGRAVAVCCCECVRSRRKITEAIEFREGKIVYHPIQTLEHMPEDE